MHNIKFSLRFNMRNSKPEIKYILEAAGEETRRKLHKNVESSIEQVLATTPHETLTIRTPAPPSRKLYK